MGMELFRPRFPQFLTFRKDEVNAAKMHSYDRALLGGLHFPMGGHTCSPNSILDDGYTREQVESHNAAGHFSLFCPQGQ